MMEGRLEELFDHIGVELPPTGKHFMGPCPIHGGKSPVGFMMYREGDEVQGYWVCHTRGCERHFRKSIIGFVRGVLSHRKLGFDGVTNLQIVPLRVAVDYLLDFLGISIEDVKVDYARIEQAKFNRIVDRLTQQPIIQDALCDRKEIRSLLRIPADYFIGRGYSPEVLDEYDVGMMKPVKKITGLVDGSLHYLKGRVIVPVYDPDGRMVIGAIGRTLIDECGKCGYWHESAPCPSNRAERNEAAKWRTTGYFTDKNHLYNFWKAKEHIYKSRCVVIVEGVSDVWRLVQAGISNSVSVFGNKISDPQEIRLQSSGAANFIVPRDMDDAGAALAEIVQKKFGLYGRVHVLDLPTKDVGDMTVAQVQELIVPFVQSKMRKEQS